MAQQHSTMTAPTRAGRSLLAATVALTMGLAVQPVAQADDLTDQRDRLKQQMASASSQVDEFSTQLNQAANALASAQRQLAQARTTERTATARRAQALAADRKAAADLASAQQALAAAKAAVARNEAALAKETRLVGVAVRQTHQQDGDLLGIAGLVNDPNTSDVNQALQWRTTIFDSTSAQLDRLHDAQTKLDAARRQQAAAEQRVATQRQAAANALAASRQAEQQARQATAAVTALVASHRQAEQAVAAQLKAEKAHQAALASESAQVDKRILARIAAQKAAAARAAAAAAAAAQAANSQVAQTTASNTKQGSAWFSAPAAAPITSPYGMRFHPVLHIWKLHDGTDYGAACNAPIRAPRAGVVSEAYFNVGYGNRLMIDHGLVNGHYITTGYNHATRYVVSVGQHVTAGQLIGYVGTTGFSTGCHLHLMVWQDGKVVNPTDTWF